ncbi:hypothetical protein J6590_047865 [Homalodisca vitripennis]|nr:hypothetical protein J6590_047865 [Homalodisca vitripennis]
MHCEWSDEFRWLGEVKFAGNSEICIVELSIYTKPTPKNCEITVAFSVNLIKIASDTMCDIEISTLVCSAENPQNPVTCKRGLGDNSRTCCRSADSGDFTYLTIPGWKIIDFYVDKTECDSDACSYLSGSERSNSSSSFSPSLIYLFWVSSQENPGVMARR